MSETMKWVTLAVLGAFFAAVVQLTSKPAMKTLDDSVVNLIRAVVMLGFFVVVAGYAWWTAPARPEGWNLDRPVLAAAALAAGSGLAAGLSWFFGYKALSLASVGQSYPIDKLSVVFAVLLAVFFLGERPSLVNWGGIMLILVGAYLVTLGAKS